MGFDAGLVTDLRGGAAVGRPVFSGVVMEGLVSGCRFGLTDKVASEKCHLTLDQTQWGNPVMTATLTLDKAGRVVIPKSLRDELHLDAGDELELSAEGDCLTLRPVRVAARLKKKHGIWVFGGTDRITAAETDAVLGGIREQRDRDNRGGSR